MWSGTGTIGCLGNTIFMAVIVQPQSWSALALIKYLDIIHRAYNSFLGSEWLKYDEMFHMHASVDPTLPLER